MNLKALWEKSLWVLSKINEEKKVLQDKNQSSLIRVHLWTTFCRTLSISYKESLGKDKFYEDPPLKLEPLLLEWLL